MCFIQPSNGKYTVFIESEMWFAQHTWPDQTRAAIISLLYMHGWIPIADEYGAQLKLMDAICLGKQSYLHCIFGPLYSLFPSLPPSQERSQLVW